VSTARPACAGLALAGRGPPPRGGKTVSSRIVAALGPAASRGAGGRHLPGAPMRRRWRGIYADHTGETRREESRRWFSGYAARASLQGPVRPVPTLRTGVRSRRFRPRSCALSSGWGVPACVTQSACAPCLQGRREQRTCPAHRRNSFRNRRDSCARSMPSPTRTRLRGREHRRVHTGTDVMTRHE
jgi:hypothetical protein